MNRNDEEERYMITEWGCLYLVLMDYGIDVSHITGAVGKHMVEDFMESMVKAGYVAKAEDAKGDKEADE